MDDRKCGVILRWNTEKRFGTIVITDTEPYQRFFLHADQIESGTLKPEVGMVVYFRVSERPVSANKFPLAIGARIDATHFEKVGGAK